MAELHLRNVPDDLVDSIEFLAKADAVPLEEETVRLLQKAVATEKPKQEPPADRTWVLDLLAEMRRNAIRPAPGTPDSVELLREDRER